MYLSGELTKTLAGNNSQGPVYRVYSSLGKQANGTKHNGGNLVFGSSARSEKYGNANMPGPGTYTHKGAFFQQTLSDRPTSPKPVFGTSSREQQEKVYLTHEAMKTYYGKESPAPNTYNLRSSMGPQFLSNKESLPLWKQGTGGR